ncbi:hypothetical protein [Kytococcus schroeteri]|uniref:hypothetical protein n=1 Tax=Kytococcus schroeteri TaxID=138300 RepID=UPI001181AF07|nr:hypothetical protein [Kytococcus schroeteri]
MHPIEVFEALIKHVEHLTESGNRCDAQGAQEAAEVHFRSAVMMAIAALDSYIHELGARKLVATIGHSSEDLSRAARYLNANECDFTTNSPEKYVRYHLTKKTLASPKQIDRLFEAIGLNPEEVWRHVAIELRSREDRVRGQLQLQFDRRNQIAHEGDWYSRDVQFRPISASHVTDCMKGVSDFVHALDVLMKEDPLSLKK